MLVVSVVVAIVATALRTSSNRRVDKMETSRSLRIQDTGKKSMPAWILGAFKAFFDLDDNLDNETTLFWDRELGASVSIPTAKGAKGAKAAKSAKSTKAAKKARRKRN